MGFRGPLYLFVSDFQLFFVCFCVMEVPKGRTTKGSFRWEEWNDEKNGTSCCGGPCVSGRRNGARGRR